LTGGISSVFSLFLVVLIPVTGCGKKADPFIPAKVFNSSVKALSGQWKGNSIMVKGKISSPEGREGSGDAIQGLRIYYASYPEKSPPCPGCPIQYDGISNFGPEVIDRETFACNLKPGERDRLYRIKVHLVGPGGILGPPSETIRVPAE
jgi:hypothetical protein